MLKPRQIRDYVRCLPRIGIDPHDFLKNAPVSLETVDRLAPVTPGQLTDLFDRISIGTPDDFAVLCGREIPPTHLGVLGYALVNCATLRDLFALWTRYSAVSHHPLTGTLHTFRDRWIFEMRPRFTMSPRSVRFCMESSVIGFSLIAKNLLRNPDLMLGVDMPFARPANAALYADFRLGEVRFDRPCLRITGALETLDLPFASADPEVREVCEARCAQQLARMADDLPFVARIEMLLAAAERFPSLEQTAAQLAVSPRTLHRELHGEGTTFRALIDTARRRRAGSRLAGGGASIKEVAWELGFSDPRNFQRVFRQWTGMPIARWVREHETGLV